jgi:ABC-type multidrug transport system ATPase subunit
VTSPGILVDGVRRAFGPVQAVRNVTLEAHAGRVTGLVGPNGSGKTTLLLMLASLLAPDAGSIRIDGVDPVTDPQAARGILGWMPDALGAWNSLTSRETLVVTGRLYGMPVPDARARAEALLAEVGLDELANAPARVLSRGQKQRLGLARALVHDPRVLLLDEPASGLDPQARIDLRVLLRRLAAEGRTILVSSHILAELEEVVDDAVFLLAGETVDPGRVEAAARRSRPWRVRLAEGDAAAAADRVASALRIPLESVSTDRRDVIVAFESDEAAAGALRELVTAGMPVAEFAAAQGTLEHTFLDLGTGVPPQVAAVPATDGTARPADVASGRAPSADAPAPAPSPPPAAPPSAPQAAPPSPPAAGSPSAPPAARPTTDEGQGS